MQGLKEVVERIERLEKEGMILPIEDVVRTDSIIPKGQEPEPGTVASSRDWPNFGATELTLSNGMKARHLKILWHPPILHTCKIFC